MSMGEQQLHLFIEFIQLEKNYSPHTVKEYETDLTHFLAFLQHESVTRFDEVDYVHARLYATQLYDAKLARTIWLAGRHSCSVLVTSCRLSLCPLVGLGSGRAASCFPSVHIA